MPRTPSIELLYLPLAAEALKMGAAKEILGVGNKQPLEKLQVEIEEPAEPILFCVFIPKITVKKLNATVTFFLEDVTGAAQIIQEYLYEGIVAVKGTGLLWECRYQPSTQATITPALQGMRSFTLQAEPSAETAEIPANTAKCVAFLQILGLGRQ
ncbi:MAG TPA: hypothetical protein VKG78_03285 [Opitutaceae bacterium]|nr:hypothetical protein [Opitutaceae bacterium]